MKEHGQNTYSLCFLAFGLASQASDAGSIYRKREKLNYDRITTTIEREWLAEIIAGTKTIEYREIKPYWTNRLAKVSVPFELRLLNGMPPPVPEVSVLIHKITRHGGEYQLHIEKVLGLSCPYQKLHRRACTLSSSL